MNLRQIQDIAGHRNVQPWVIKLVQDCIEHDRMYEKAQPQGDTVAGSPSWEAFDIAIQSAIEATKEKAAKLCDEYDRSYGYECAAAIRSMK
jgi:hypothetical protein